MESKTSNSVAPPEGFTLGRPPRKGHPLPQVMIRHKGAWQGVDVSLAVGSQRALRYRLPGLAQTVSINAGRAEDMCWRPVTASAPPATSSGYDPAPEASNYRGAPVRFVIDDPGLGVLSLHDAIGPGASAFREEIARDGDVGLYHGVHPTMPVWHLITVRLADDPREHLVVPVHADQFVRLV